MIIALWDGISVDVSVTAIEEGIKQYKKRIFDEEPCIMIHRSHTWAKEYFPNNRIIFTNVINDYCFMLIGNHGLFIGSDPI